jgi:hypothetical protein
MQAVRGPQNDYSIARLFLSSDFSTVWDPDESVTIRTSTAVARTGPAESSMLYSLTSTARVDADGRYFEQKPAEQTLEFRFAKEGGEWRISQAPNGIVLSQSTFTVVFTERALYFFDPSFGYLVPDVRWFPARATVSVRIARALLAGPASWLKQGAVVTAFPDATTLGTSTVRFQSNTAIVDLSAQALAASPKQRDRMRQQLIATLGATEVDMTVGGVELTTPAPSSKALVDPPVDGAVLVGTGNQFGLDAGDGISAIAGISGPAVSLGAIDVALANDKRAAAILSGDGAVYAVRVGGTPVAVDGRPGLTAPSIDPFGFVWSAQGANAESITTHDVAGAEHPIQSSLPPGASIVSMSVSRDGARLLLYLSTAQGPRLVVVGIIRGQGRVPTQLGELLDLPAAQNPPIDATWVDERTVATLSRSGSGALVTVFEVGGASAQLGQVPDATSLVGGNGGLAGMRLLRTSGEVWRPQGGGGWVNTGIIASFLATKQ